MRKFLMPFFLGLALLSNAQNVQTSIDQVNAKFDESVSGYINGLIYKADQNYTKALFEFERVNRNDSLYDKAQLEMAFIYFKQKDDSSIVDLCLNALKLESEYDVSFREYLLEALTNLKDDEVFMQLAIAKSKYPYNETFLLKEAKAYRRFERYNDCKAVLQKVIKNNPFCGNAHYYLGKLMADEGDFIRASISLETFLLLSSESTLKTDTAIDVLNQLFNNKYEVSIKNAKRNDLFKEVEELVESKVALNSKYKADAPLTFNMSKQSDLIVKNIKYKSGTGDFWMDFYVPFLVDVKSKKFVRAYNYQFLSFLSDVNVQKGMAKFKPEIDAYVQFASDYFDKLREESGMMIEGKEVKMPKYYDDGYLWGVGKMEDSKKRGLWYFFNNLGVLQSKATYNNDGKLIDSVYTFHDNGKKESVYYSKNGLTHGKYISYHPNGELSVQFNFREDSLDGEQREYDLNGGPEEISNYNNGKLHGVNQKFESGGTLASEFMYRNGKRDGKQYYYYHDKKLEVEMDYKNGKADGKYTSYYKNGKAKKKGQYLNDISVGKWEDYYSTGVLSGYFYVNEKGNYIDSSLTFYPNGKLETVIHFNGKGKKHGAAYTYTDKGTLWYVFNYKNGIVKNYTYYTADGKIVHQGKLDVQNYDEFGRLTSKGSYKKELRTGRWEFFYPNGETREVCTYDAFGNLTDLDETFYQSGELKSKTYYRDGNRVNNYVSYHENGKMHIKGYYLNDDSRGEWTWWHSNGNPDEIDYFQQGTVNGIVQIFHPDSTPNYEARYIMGNLRDFYYYDTKGAETFTIETKNGNGKYQVKDPLTNITYSGAYKYAKLDGKVQSITDNGVVLSESNYAEGVRNGIQKYRYPSGVINTENNYVFGDKHGISKHYYADGTVSQIHHFDYGNEVDTALYFYPSGAVYCKITYDAFGEENGLSTWYFENGKVKKTMMSKNDKLHGWAYDYDEAGHQYLQRYYENGVLFKAKGLGANGKDTLVVNTGKGRGADSLTFFHDNGKVAFSAKAQRGLWEGIVLRYNYNGQLMEKGQYFHDDRDGEFLVYYSNGKLYSSEIYSMGELHGERKEYYDNTQLCEHENYYLGDKHGAVKLYSKKGIVLVDVDYIHGDVKKNKMKK